MWVNAMSISGYLRTEVGGFSAAFEERATDG
jgi:hypothetical protein